MTTPTPNLMTAEQAEEDRIDRLRLRAFKTNNEDDRRKYFEATSKWYQDRHYRGIALHEALSAANAKIAELEAGASRSLFVLMTDRALAAEARADVAFALGVEAGASVDFPDDWRDARGIREQKLFAEGFRACRDAIRALAPTTPLQAALALPEACERNARLCEVLFRKGVSPEKWPDYFLVPAAGDAILAKLEAKG